jgi:hypothetical protein
MNKGTKLKNYKGDIYTVLGRGTHAKTLEEIIICEKNSDKSILLQPLDSLHEDVAHNGVIVPRFEIISVGRYGGVPTVMIELEVGTKFFVHNGVWNGEIILRDGKKCVLIEGDKVENAMECSVDKTLDITIVDSFRNNYNN